MRGRCERCGELMEPNADRTLCVRSTLFWVLAVGGILGSVLLEWLRRKYNECIDGWRARKYKRHTDEIELDIESGGRAFEYDCFLTHDWGEDEKSRPNHDRVSEVNRLLKAQGLVTWFDEERMQGNVVAQMTNGIDRSATVIVFVTQRYCAKVAGKGDAGDDDNCKREFEYACLRKGVAKMITVVMEPCCRDTKKWQGGVGFNLGGRLYKDLSDDEMKAMPQLIEEIIQISGRRPNPPALSRSAESNTKMALNQLGSDQVCALLHGLELGEHARAFSEAKVRGADLANANEDDLTTLGMPSPLKRKGLLRQLSGLKRDGVPISLLAPAPTSPLAAGPRKLVRQLSNDAGMGHLSSAPRTNDAPAARRPRRTRPPLARRSPAGRGALGVRTVLPIVSRKLSNSA